MSTDNDIVPRMRLWADAITEAADEIERLRNTRDALETERDELIRIANKLTRERDEARREVCKMEAELPEDRVRVWNAARSPNDLAAKRGWDCFDRSKYAKRRKPIAK